MKTTASTITSAAVSDLRSSTTDASVIADCDRVLFWLSSGAAAMGVRCRAVSRVCALIA